MRPIMLEVISPAMVTFELHWERWKSTFSKDTLSRRFREQQLEEYPEEFREGCFLLSEWIQDLKKIYRHRLQIRILDAQSPLGIFKQLKYGIKYFPAFIVEGKHQYIGWDRIELEAIIDRCLLE